MSETNAMNDAANCAGHRTPTVAELFAAAGLVAPVSSTTQRSRRRRVLAPTVMGPVVVALVILGIVAAIRIV